MTTTTKPAGKTGTKQPARKPAAKKRESKFEALDARIVQITNDPQIRDYDELIAALGNTAKDQPIRWRCMLLTKRQQIPAGFWKKS